MSFESLGILCRVMATMFDRPDSSLTSTRRSLPTASGSMCS